jgi:hypothetical protein
MQTMVAQAGMRSAWRRPRNPRRTTWQDRTYKKPSPPAHRLRGQRERRARRAHRRHEHEAHDRGPGRQQHGEDAEAHVAGGAWVDQTTYNSDQTNTAVTVAAGEEWRLVQVTQQAIKDVRYKLSCES